MTDPREHEDGERGDDVVAAEYVLGVLSATERADVARRIDSDRGFAMQVSDWEERLSGMNGAYGEEQPPARVWDALEDRLFAVADEAPDLRAGLWHSLAFWRSVSLSAIAAVAVLAIILLNGLATPVPGPQQIAALAAVESEASFVALRDTDGAIRLTRTGTTAPIDHVYELWAIAGGEVPISLGLLEDGEVTLTALPGELAAMADGAITLAVTVEPPGGAPSGTDHGPVVAIGPLMKI